MQHAGSPDKTLAAAEQHSPPLAVQAPARCRSVPGARCLWLVFIASLGVASASAVCLEEAVPVADIPATVMDAGIAVRAGFVVDSGARIGRGEETVYELEGWADGRPLEVIIAPDGTVLSIEEDADDRR